MFEVEFPTNPPILLFLYPSVLASNLTTKEQVNKLSMSMHLWERHALYLVLLLLPNHFATCISKACCFCRVTPLQTPPKIMRHIQINLGIQKTNL